MLGSARASDEREFYDFASYHDRPYRKNGFYSCALEDLLRNDGHNAKQAVKELGPRMLPAESAGKVSLKNTDAHGPGRIPATAKHRYLVNFLCNSVVQPSTPTEGTKELLQKLYISDLKPELESVMNFGDADKCRPPSVVISEILDHPFSTHVVLVGHQKVKSKNGFSVEPEALAAVSFCSHEKKIDGIFIGLCAVSSGNQTKSFGTKSNGEPWRGRGFLEFLLSVCQTLHRSQYRYNGRLWTYVSLLNSYTYYPAFVKMGFTPAAYNFKDCFGQPYTEDYANYPTARALLDTVPFLCEGIVMGKLGKLFWNLF